MSAEIINLLCEKLGLAVEWAGENIVPQAEELMAQLAATQCSLNRLFWIIGFIVFVGCIALIICDTKFNWSYGAVTTVAIIFGLFSVTVFVVCLVYTIKWKQMPDIMCYKWLLDAMK